MFKKLILILLFTLIFGVLATNSNALILWPYKLFDTMPDNSQYASDYDPKPAHGDKWGNMMCAPTSAKNSMVWLANTYSGHEKLKKQKKADGSWKDVSHDKLIEELAKKMVPGWDWDNKMFPGVHDDEFVKGKKAYAEERGVKLNIKWAKKQSLNLSWGEETLAEPNIKWIKKEIDHGEDVEISTPWHWVTVDVDNVWLKEFVTVAGYLGDKFEDLNGNGFWDPGEDFWDTNYLGLDLGSPDIYDFHLFINDPASSNDGWQLAEMKNGQLHVGSLGYIETAVSESPIPEPSTCLLFGTGILLTFCCLAYRRQKSRL